MALRVEYTGKKLGADPYTTIVSVGGRGKLDARHWSVPVAKVIEEIETGIQTYYINVNGFTPNLVVAVRDGVKYLKAPFDPDEPSSLLGLPDC